MPDKKDKRPPAGVEPRALWLQARAQELAAAIARYVVNGYNGGEYVKTLEAWLCELLAILKQREVRNERS